ncbi:DoxX family membrane protein [Mesorhizobium sp. M7A.F.Ca.US.006.04.2.1]|uniref:DoxX family protein n=1 Tax=unclassified Mesorhizobium TaxID=325217 RepID=UPI000FCC1433|nr:MULTISPECIES: DoxX family membrane protein [unclassified Mesorhizobium]RUX76898.1 DoxX family membrane protein [Mesorhizobium sp. M7A.F.Ca.US.005.03.1.1]RUY11178.1 DoxX family membrane protein [Mesorhizobium sp. M7A.F.Ca.US.005.03.2.1]RVA81339.1 DoxX family membrane protein [Mesorhizobium sp. M7A.F.Ca.US.006.04.2.1]
MPAILVTFTVRCLLVALFLPFSALDKVLNFEQAIDQASQAIPGRSFAAVMIAGGFFVEVFMSLAILGGVADRLAALILAGYCLVTALLWKQFWRRPDFRLKGRSEARDVFWDFLKNLALAGGFLLLAFGSNAAEVDRFIRHPLASSHPYQTVQEDLR